MSDLHVKNKSLMEQRLWFEVQSSIIESDAALLVPLSPPPVK